MDKYTIEIELNLDRDQYRQIQKLLAEGWIQSAAELIEESIKSDLTLDEILERETKFMEGKGD